VTVDASDRFAYVVNQADDTVSMYTINQCQFRSLDADDPSHRVNRILSFWRHR